METLGARGLTQQIKATDKQGKTLLMYAARHADAPVFIRSHELVDALLSKKDTFSLCLARDDEGRTLLHHAAEARSEQMLRKVTCSILYVVTSVCCRRQTVHTTWPSFDPKRLIAHPNSSIQLNFDNFPRRSAWGLGFGAGLGFT